MNNNELNNNKKNPKEIKIDYICTRKNCKTFFVSFKSKGIEEQELYKGTTSMTNPQDVLVVGHCYSFSAP